MKIRSQERSAFVNSLSVSRRQFVVSSSLAGLATLPLPKVFSEPATLDYSLRPYKLGNAFLATCGIYGAMDDALMFSEDDGFTFRRLASFQGATRGLRTVFRSREGYVFASPEGSQLMDGQKGLWRSGHEHGEFKKVIDLSGEPNPVSVSSLIETSSSALLAGTFTAASRCSLAKIYRSTDLGASWDSVYSDATGRHVHSIAYDRFSDTIYASIGDDFGSWRTKRLIKSTDGGTSWDEFLSELPQIKPILALPRRRIFGTDSNAIAGIYISHDDIGFSRVYDLQENSYVSWLRALDESTVVAGAVAASDEAAFTVLLSRNGGLTWAPLSSGRAVKKWDGPSFASNVSQGRFLISGHLDRTLQPTVSLAMKYHAG